MVPDGANGVYGSNGHRAHGDDPADSAAAAAPPPPSPSDNPFNSLLYPPPQSTSGKVVYAVYGAYNSAAQRAAPYLPIRPIPIPHQEYSPLNDSERQADQDPDQRDANDQDHATSPADQPNPAQVYSHLTQRDVLAQLGVTTEIVPNDDSSNDERDNKGDESDTAGIRFAHLQHGLSQAQVNQRRGQYGKNSFAEREQESALDRLLEQLSEPMILLLLASAAISFAIGQRDDAISITLAIAIVVTVGWVQEQRSEKSLEALNSLVPNYCHLIRPEAPEPAANDHLGDDSNDTASVRSGHSNRSASLRSNSDQQPGGTSDSDDLGIQVMADELVPGDVVTFSTGDRIPADIRLFHAVQLEIDESTLTGEITPRKKSTGVVKPRWPLDQIDRRIKQQQQQAQEEREQNEQGSASGSQAAADDDADDESDTSDDDQSKDNIVFLGTMVKSGYGRGVVVSIGLETEFGGVFSMVDDVEEKRTPLQRSMDDLAKKLTLASFAVIGIICVVGVIQRRPVLELATIAISLAVAAIPEGLPIVVTVTLALGVLRMSKRNVIVKRLPSVETLGSVSVICTDKTGTLTENHMTIVKLYTVQDGVVDVPREAPPGEQQLSTALVQTLLIGNVCNRAQVDRTGQLNGSHTEVAMIDVLEKFNLQDRRHEFRQTDEIPFDTNWKYMTVVGHLDEQSAQDNFEKEERGWSKGAPEAILARCSHVLGKEGKAIKLDDRLTKDIETTIDNLASEGLRVLAVATGPKLNESDHEDPEKVNKNLTFVGLDALQDPPRKGVKSAIGELVKSGVHIVMVTGDAPSTAVGIAKQLGILHHSTPSPSEGPGTSGVMTGKQVDQMSTEQLRDISPSVSVFARTTPKHKMAIVSAFQQDNQVVAMTGDGVNDAPALKLADIGIAMGASGTDVAKEAADVILVDDNFVTILNAVEEGKGIFGNIQNFLAFQLSTSVAALFLILLSIMFGLQLPLNAMQVLLINLACDGPPAQSLGVDPADASVFRKPPRPKNKPVLDKRVGFNLLFSSSLILIGTLFTYVHEARPDGTPDQRDLAMTFVTFVSLDLITAVQCRGLHVGLFANTAMSLTILVSYIVLTGLIYFPPLQAIFQTIPLSWPDLTYVVILTGLTFGVHELRRDWQRKRDSVRAEREVRALSAA